MNDRITSRTQTQVAQLLLCRGCCCGKTERGFPDVPVERIKAAWKAEKLNRSVQLTISGCLGPCDVPNVALVLLPSGQEWLANLSGDDHYEFLIEWARACHAEGRLLPLPSAFDDHRLERFVASKPIVCDAAAPACDEGQQPKAAVLPGDCYDRT